MVSDSCVVLVWKGGVSAEEMERRAAYLKEQRDRIKASHKAQRDAKLAKYQDEKRRGDTDDNAMPPTPGHPHTPIQQRTHSDVLFSSEP